MEIKKLIPQTNLATTEAELILAHVIKKSREFILAHPEKNINKIQIKKYNQLINKRLKNIPLAYLTGYKEFFGLNFLVNKNVLIPRPDTEIIIEKVLQEIKKNKNQKIILIDIGTGTGCIPISIIKTLKQLSNIPTNKLNQIEKNITTLAIDISKKALALAQKNAQKHQVKINFLHGNLLKPITKSKIFKQKSKIIITANLPYLTLKQIKQEPSIQHEPKLALLAGNDGLKYYRQLFKQLQKKLFFTSYSLFIEIDPSQTTLIKKLIKKYFPKAKITIYQDLTKKNRIIKII